MSVSRVQAFSVKSNSNEENSILELILSFTATLTISEGMAILKKNEFSETGSDLKTAEAQMINHFENLSQDLQRIVSNFFFQIISNSQKNDLSSSKSMSSNDLNLIHDIRLKVKTIEILRSLKNTISSTNRVHSIIQNLIQNLKSPFKLDQFYCAICMDSRDITETLFLSNCAHQVCEYCFQQHISTYLETKPGLFKNPDCPLCGEEILKSQLETLVDAETMKKIIERALNKESNKNDLHEEFLQERIEEIDLNKESNKKDLDEELLQEWIEEMDNMEGGVTQCPRCRYPYIKNPRTCGHVYCIQPGCGVDFCFQCACLRSPTLEHGNHYHRKECKYYAPIDPEFIKQHKELGQRNCSECKRLGYKHLGVQHCPPPKSLRKPRRVDPDEVE